ncbi:MAG: glyoxalase family protein [Rhodobacteraceae bacterium HLUCCA12]|nr:MAG: glyoxalase family protein [Rhodobacteraceae bacterium HLUCCA12]
MPNPIQGLHHVTSMAAHARRNNAFYTGTLGLRRVKKTVNFDEPSVYHLYFGNRHGTPGSVMTCFPFPHIAPGRPGTGEASQTVFSVPEGALAYWRERLPEHAVTVLDDGMRFDEKRLHLAGPDGEILALVEVADDARTPHSDGPVPADTGLRGFHSVTLRLRDSTETGELLRFMGYREVARQGGFTRYALDMGNGANVIDIETTQAPAAARLGAGSVHHVAFAVADRAAQDRVRDNLVSAGYQPTPVIDRDYFLSVYFRTPGGVLFEIATNEPGFDRDEAPDQLGQALKIPAQHAHLRERIEKSLPPLDD